MYYYSTYSALLFIFRYTYVCVYMYVQGSAVQCTCPGFKIQSLVKLWQSFRSYSLSAVISALPQISCSTCQHTLQSHQQENTEADQSNITTPLKHNSVVSTTHPSLPFPFDQPLRLSLKVSGKLIYSPMGECVQLLPPVGGRGRVGLVSLCVMEGGLSVAVCLAGLSPRGARSGGGEQNEKEGGEASSDKRGDTQNEEERGSVPCEVADKASSTNLSAPSCITDLSTLTSSSVQKGQGKEEGEGEGEDAPKAAAKRRRKRKRITPATISHRKSTRIQQQTKNKSQNGLSNCLKLEREREAEEREEARRERERVCEIMASFVSSLEKHDSYQIYPLPEVSTIHASKMHEIQHFMYYVKYV